MEHALTGSLVRYRAVMEELEKAYPGLDDETLRDTVEGETDLDDHITRVIRSRREDLAMVAALKEQMAEMRERLERLKGRADAKRDLVASAMAEAGLKTLCEPDFTLSLRPIPPAVVVTDEGAIPEEFWVAQAPKLDRQGLSAALKRGQAVPGATLGNGSMTIAVRTT